MNIIIIGYGKMGKLVCSLAEERGHKITCIIDNEQDWKKLDENCDIAIDFSTLDVAPNNIIKCFELHIPIVVGTTGWYDTLPEITKICNRLNGTLFYASNFSLGVFLFNKINILTAQLLSNHKGYDKLNIKEIHHINKKDAPSGTALWLKENISQYYDEIKIESMREGEVCGIHEICYESPVDIISLKHEAKSRKGFALGAVVAAEFLQGRQGIFTMNDLI